MVSKADPGGAVVVQRDSSTVACGTARWAEQCSTVLQCRWGEPGASSRWELLLYEVADSRTAVFKSHQRWLP